MRLLKKEYRKLLSLKEQKEADEEAAEKLKKEKNENKKGFVDQILEVIREGSDRHDFFLMMLVLLKLKNSNFSTTARYTKVQEALQGPESQR